MRRALSEPLLWFLILGGGLFFALRGTEEAPDRRTQVDLEPAMVEELRTLHRQRTGRDVSAEDVSAAYLREEALVREAQSLGLDQGDAIVRRRLIQKMELLLRGLSEPEPPTDEELRAYYDAHRDQYTRDGTTTFEHAFFRRADPSAESRAADPDDDGDPFPRGRRIEGAVTRTLADYYGPRFARSVGELEVDQASEPIESSFGWHRVRVTERAPSRPLTFDEAKRETRRDLRRERAEAAYEEAAAALITKYELSRGGE